MLSDLSSASWQKLYLKKNNFVRPRFSFVFLCLGGNRDLASADYQKPGTCEQVAPTQEAVDNQCNFRG